jgi:hypothetical protein
MRQLSARRGGCPLRGSAREACPRRAIIGIGMVM